MGRSHVIIYIWLPFNLWFILIDVSAGHSIKSTLAATPVSRYDSLGDEARTQLGTCGSANTNVECNPGDVNNSCTYECDLLHDFPDKYNNSCKFIEDNCAGEYELLNYLQFMECHLGPNLRVIAFAYLYIC